MQNFWFQQDGETAHTARETKTFLGRLISFSGDVPWPPRSPEFFLWGYLYGKIY